MQTIRFCPRCGHATDSGIKYGKQRNFCPACGYIHFADPKVAVVLFIEENNRVLLVKRKIDPEHGKWALVAGYVDRGEDPTQTAIREAQEETGLNIEIDHLIDVGFAQQNGTILIMYAARVVGGTLSAANDAEAAGWFDPDPNQLPELAFDSTHRLVRAWIARMQGNTQEISRNLDEGTNPTPRRPV